MMSANAGEIIRAMLVGDPNLGVFTPFYSDAKFGSENVRCCISREAFNTLCDRFASDCDKGRPADGKSYSY